MIKYKKLSEYKKNLKLSSNQKQILVGLLLGDGHLETQNNGRTFRLLIEQSVFHADYCDHLYSIFSDWVLTPPKIHTRKNGLKSKKFKTFSHPSFRVYGFQFYEIKLDKKRKKLPKLITRWLTAQSLAYWFMDDGSWKSKTSYGIILNTQNFYLNEVHILCEIFKKKWDLNCWPRKQKNKYYNKIYYQIYISGSSCSKFVQLIYPYLIDSMLNKLPPPYLKKLREHSCLKGNGGLQRFPQTGRKSVVECKGKRKLDCKTYKSSRGESRP